MMADPSWISTGAALVGTGAWFADKIFGPSADALGTNLKVHLQSRLPQIFGRAEEIARLEGRQIEQVKPGLLTRMIIDASSSEEAPEITDWWAGLFVSAGSHQVETNVHAVFSDIMAMIGPKEADVLKEFVAYYRRHTNIIAAPYRDAARRMGTLIQEMLLSNVLELFPPDGSNIERIHKHFANPMIPLPVRTFAWSIPEKRDAGNQWTMTTERWFSENQLEIAILERARVFKFLRVDIPILGERSAFVDLVGLTELGVEFYKACTRSALEGDVDERT